MLTDILSMIPNPFHRAQGPKHVQNFADGRGILHHESDHRAHGNRVVVVDALILLHNRNRRIRVVPGE